MSPSSSGCRPPGHKPLARFGIEPDGRLTPEDLAGLPLPERLFE
jgi:hypothetical protein